jgi:hypothetical protein
MADDKQTPPPVEKMTQVRTHIALDLPEGEEDKELLRRMDARAKRQLAPKPAEKLGKYGRFGRNFKLFRYGIYVLAVLMGLLLALKTLLAAG